MFRPFVLLLARAFLHSVTQLCAKRLPRAMDWLSVTGWWLVWTVATVVVVVLDSEEFFILRQSKRCRHVLNIYRRAFHFFLMVLREEPWVALFRWNSLWSRVAVLRSSVSEFYYCQEQIESSSLCFAQECSCLSIFLPFCSRNNSQEFQAIKLK